VRPARTAATSSPSPPGGAAVIRSRPSRPRPPPRSSPRAVDLLLPAPWPVCAQKVGWDPAGNTALTIRRPAAWADQAASFGQYQKPIRALIAQDSEAIVAGRVAGWAAAAASGLAWATCPGGRPKAAGALLAWTALNAEPMLDARTIQAHISGLRPRNSWWRCRRQDWAITEPLDSSKAANRLVVP
jgi:hypothetical protein